MCGSMADNQSATAEIRRGKKKKERRRKIEETTGQNIMSASATQGGHNEKLKTAQAGELKCHKRAGKCQIPLR